MLAELRAKSQITLPEVIVEKIGLMTGDLVQITEQDGVIMLIPVTGAPKKSVQPITLASEYCLAKDWLSKEEDDAWANL